MKCRCNLESGNLPRLTPKLGRWAEPLNALFDDAWELEDIIDFRSQSVTVRRELPPLQCLNLATLFRHLFQGRMQTVLQAESGSVVTEILLRRPTPQALGTIRP